MMPRDHLVGTIIGEGSEARLFTKFVGEGSQFVVYGCAPLDDPSNDAWVLKLLKGMPCLEMRTLHYSPAHPRNALPRSSITHGPRRKAGEVNVGNAGVDGDGPLAFPGGIVSAASEPHRYRAG